MGSAHLSGGEQNSGRQPGTFGAMEVSKCDMAGRVRALSLMLFGIGLAFPQQPTAPATEDAIQKTVPDRKLDQGDEPCGHYLWISTKNGIKFLYYFFGSTAWGKGKIGFYQQNLYRVMIDPDKEPPTVQRVTSSGGGVSEIRIRMTREELAASSACLSEP